MNPVMDWEKESQGGDYMVYPEGTYKVSITSYEQVTASTGTKQIRWRASILEPVDYINKPITIHTPLTEKSLWKIALLVKACGVDMKALGTMEVNTPAFLHVLDRVVRKTTYWHLTVTLDNKGKERNEVDDFKLDAEQEIETITVDEDVPEFLRDDKA
jgi:hypothetical protein